MATVNAAEALGLADLVGQLRAGFSADVLVLDGDPLRDLAALERIEAVFARGRLHAPAAGCATRATRPGRLDSSLSSA